MNRRSFTRGLASLGLTPALPLPAIGGGSASAAIATASAEKMYFMGWYTARLNKTCSPEMLVSELNIDAGTAREIFGQLVQSETVSVPNALGISRTVDPLAESFARVTTQAAKQMMGEPSKANLRENIEKVKRVIGEEPHTDDVADIEPEVPVEEEPVTET